MVNSNLFVRDVLICNDDDDNDMLLIREEVMLVGIDVKHFQLAESVSCSVRLAKLQAFFPASRDPAHERL